MIKYQRVHGVEINASSTLPRLQVTPEGLAMGGVPGWLALSHPEYTVDDLRIRNIAQSGSFFNIRYSSEGGISFGEMPGGQLSIRSMDEASVNYEVGVDLNPDQWTAFAVVKPVVVDQAYPQAIFRPEEESRAGDEVGLQFGMSPSTRTVAIYDNPTSGSGSTRLEYTGVNLSQRDSPSLLMATFSLSRGLAIYDGGQVVAQNPNDTRPLELSVSGERNLQFMRNARGDFGISGILGVDLSEPVNNGHRRAIEKFLMTKYGIS